MLQYFFSVLLTNNLQVGNVQPIFFSSALYEERGIIMTKVQLIDVVSKNAKISKAAAAKAVDSIFSSISKSLKKGEKVTLVGFGTFSISKRKARRGRNPQTGSEIKIPATRVPKFTAGKALKKSVK